MAVQIQGNGGVIAEVDGALFRAQRFTPRPIDHGSLGAYAWGGFTGILPAALAANSEIFQFRWANGTNLAIIRKIRLSAVVSTTMFAAGVPVQIDLIKSSLWTNPGTGGTAVTIGANCKRRANMANSLMVGGDMRIATTAALGLGTKTLEGAPLAAIAAPGPITGSLNGEIIAPNTTLWQAEIGDGEHPLVLAQNEGFSIRSVAVPGAGTWTVGISIDWAEVVSY
jgi:hypothetical protein